MSIEIIKKEKGIIYCRIKSIQSITDSLIDSLPWRKDTNRILFEFDEIISGEYKILKENVSSKYSVRLIYYVSADDLINPRIVSSATNIVIEKVDLSEIQAFYLSTVSKLSRELPDKMAEAKLNFSKINEKKIKVFNLTSYTKGALKNNFAF